MARFTPSQLQEALDISKETLRYWKKEFPVLAHRKKPRACFGPADLLTAAIIKQLTELGLPVRRIAPIIQKIYQHCKDTGWFALERQILEIRLRSGEVSFSGEVHVPHNEPTLSVPLAPLISGLRAHLLQDDQVEQWNLALGPMSVVGGIHS